MKKKMHEDMERKLYFAGGCFWGTAHFFSRVGGVSAAVAGYANGRGAHPSYEEVYTDTTGFAETVEVRFDPERVSPALLTRLFFLLIDPCSLNRQGGDAGTRYRTGIWWPDEAGRAGVLPVWEEMRARYGAGFVVEAGPLQNFYPAEERHQAYLDKNPGGYCHIPLKTFRYQKLFEAARALLEGEDDPVTVMASLSALVQEGMKFFWTGFYRVKGEELVLGPFQGPAACLRIARGRGVCGTAWAEERTVVVPDVEAFPGHIACSSLSRSEIVVPWRVDGRIVAVLDIDSTETDTFDALDASWLELLLDLAAQGLSAAGK